MTTPTDTRAAAARYVTGGFALCPIPHGKKGPVIKGWQQLANCLTSPDDLPTGISNYGLVHEHSGTVALDLDDMDAARAFFTGRGLDLDELVASSTYAIESARGVKPVYRVEGMTPPRVYKHLDPGDKKRVIFELRGAGGQDVLPPSQHPDGSVYRWRNGLEPTGPLDLDPIPMRLLMLWGELLAEKDAARPSTPAAPRPRLELPDDKEQRRMVAYVEGALKREAAQLRALPPGGRNEALNSASYGLWGYVPTLEEAGVDTGPVETALYEELYSAALDAGLPNHEVNATLQSASTAGRDNPRAIPPPRNTSTSTRPGAATSEARAPATPPAGNPASTTTTPAPADAYPLDGLEPLRGELWPQPSVSVKGGDGKRYADDDLLRILGYPEEVADVAGVATDVALSRRVRWWHGDDLRYNPGLGWLVWDGRRWEQSEDKATALGERAVGMLRKEARALRMLAERHDSEEVTALKHTAAHLDTAARKRGESVNAIKNALTLLRPKVFADTRQFEIKPFVFAFDNGVWDRGEFRQHDRLDHNLNTSPVVYDPDADTTAWFTVLERVTGGDADLAKTLQHVCGYALSAHSNLRTIPWFYGGKATGKSTVTQILATVLGDNYRALDTADLKENSSRNRLGASLYGTRVAALQEASGTALSNDLLKTLSGGDMVTAEYKYKEPFTFSPRHVLLAVSNDAPRVYAYDDALKDRILAIPFNDRLDAGGLLFGGANLKDLATDPSSDLVRGFASWAVEGMAEIAARQSIHRAAAVVRATSEMWADIDPLTPFWEYLDDHGGYQTEYSFITTNLRAGCKASDLFGAYKAWAKDDGIRMPLTQKSFSAACKGVGLDHQHRRDGKYYALPEDRDTVIDDRTARTSTTPATHEVLPGDAFYTWLRARAGRVTDGVTAVTDGDGRGVTGFEPSETTFLPPCDGLTAKPGKCKEKKNEKGDNKSCGVLSANSRQPVTPTHDARPTREKSVTGLPSRPVTSRHVPSHHPLDLDPQLFTGLLVAIRSGSLDDLDAAPELRRLDREMTYSPHSSTTARRRLEEFALELSTQLVEGGHVRR